MSFNELTKIENNFNHLKIIAIYDKYFVKFNVYQIKLNYFYESSYQFKYFLSFKFFSQKKTMKEIIELIIFGKNLNIIGNGEKLIINPEKYPKIELKLFKKEINLTDNKLIQKLFNHNLLNYHFSFFVSYIINSISIFPSGNLIVITNNNIIIIYNNYFKILQIIKDEKNNFWNGNGYVSVKDENNFVFCSGQYIKFYTKKYIKNNDKNSEFVIHQIIKQNAFLYEYQINFLTNENMISCTHNLINIWEKNNINNKYQKITSLIFSDYFESFLLFEDKNILITSNSKYTKFWNLNNYENYYNINEGVYFKNTFRRIDKDKFIFGLKDGILKIFSIYEKKCIAVLKEKFYCFSICVIREHGIFLASGENNNIKVYKTSNFKFIQIIKNAHCKNIIGFIQLKNDLVLSYGMDNELNIWSCK